MEGEYEFNGNNLVIENASESPAPALAKGSPPPLPHSSQTAKGHGRRAAADSTARALISFRLRFVFR